MTIDEELENFDTDDFLAALDDDDFVEEKSKNADDTHEKEIEFELCEDVQDFWERNNDVITKIVKDQQNKDSKALVLYRPRISLLAKTENEDYTDKYTVIEEDDDFKKENKDTLEIIELDDFDQVNQPTFDPLDEDMMMET